MRHLFATVANYGHHFGTAGGEQCGKIAMEVVRMLEVG
jgi:hypothetical protein